MRVPCEDRVKTRRTAGIQVAGGAAADFRCNEGCACALSASGQHPVRLFQLGLLELVDAGVELVKAGFQVIAGRTQLVQRWGPDCATRCCPWSCSLAWVAPPCDPWPPRIMKNIINGQIMVISKGSTCLIELPPVSADDSSPRYPPDLKVL
jgi:hypothetical protein